jgi:hypothetical protein
MSVKEGDCSASPSAPQTVNSTTLTTLKPQEGSVQAGGLANFTFRTPAAGSGPTWPYGVYITCVPLTGSGSAAVSVLARSDSQWPRVGFSQWQATTGSSGSSSSLPGAVVLRIEPGSGTSSAPCVPSTMAGCVYSIAITSSSATRFLVTASLSAPVLALLPNAAVPRDGAWLTAGQADHWSAALGTNTGAASSLSLAVESCMGSSSLFVNYRTPAIPSSAASDLSSTSSSAVQELTVPVSSGQPSPVIATVMSSASGGGSTQYRLASLVGTSWSSASPSTSDAVLKLQSYSSTTAGRIRIRMQPAAIPLAVQQQTVVQPAGAQGVIKYSVYVMAAGDEIKNGLNAASRCGLTQLPATLRVNLTAAQVTSVNSVIELKAPSKLSAQRYSIVVLAEHVWRSTQQGVTVDEPSTPGFLVYTPLLNVRAGTYQPDDDGGSGGADDGGDVSGQSTGGAARLGSSGSLQPFIIAGVVLGVVLVLIAGIGVRWWWMTSGRKEMQLAPDGTELSHAQQQQQQHQQPLILQSA